MRSAVRNLKKQDKDLAELILRAGPCRLVPSKKRSPFESLAESITYQQLNGKAAAAIWARVLNIYGGKLGRPAEVLKTKSSLLRAAGLSEAKTIAIKDLARKASEGIVPSWGKLEKLDDDEIIERLTEVRGVGAWTVQMMLIFQLGRPDVMPATDFGVQKGFQLTFDKAEMPKPKELLIASEIWRPYRTVAAWYLWRAVDLHRQKPPAGRSSTGKDQILETGGKAKPKSRSLRKSK